MRTIVRAFMLGVSLLSLHVAIFSQTQVPKSIPNSTSPDGVIGFLEFKPSDYGTQKHPLIIFLHGIGERGNGSASQVGWVAANGTPNLCANGASMRFTVNGQTSSFVVLSPQLSVQYGYWPTYYIKEMIKYAKANLSIDPNRIYIAGLSLGGGGVWRALTEVTDNDYTFDAGIAAAAPCCGTQEEIDNNVCSCIAANHTPIWAFHSMDDGTVGVGATQHAEILLGRCNMTPTPKFTYYQSGNHAGAWINAFDPNHITVPVNVNGVVSNFTQNPNVYEWFLSNTRGAAAPAVSYTAPIANAGTAQTITLPISVVTLTGTGTGTNGASITSYSWAQTSGPSAGTISLPLLNTTIVTGLVQGSYVFTLTVTDNHGLTSTSSVTITVNPLAALLPVLPVANKTPTASAGANQTITLPTNSITLDASASFDPDGYIAAAHWTQTAGPAGAVMNNRETLTTTVTGLVAGTYTFVVQVTDNAGAAAWATVTITVNDAPPVVTAQPVNQAPVANAGSNITITLPTNSVNLDGSGSNDPDGYLAAYYWTETSGAVGPVITNRASATTTVTGLVAGTYNYVLQVTDNSGLSAYSLVTVTVNPAAVTTPTGNAQPIGYIKQSTGYYQACGDATTSGRMAIYSSSVANGSMVYTDAAMTQPYNGGWNWFSYSPTSTGSVTLAFSVYPDGIIHLLAACPGNTVPVTPPVVTPTSNLLGYIKISVGPYQACDDASSSSRIPIYGTSVANGSTVYADAAMTQPYNGGWNWFSFTPVLGGPTYAAFAIYPGGTTGLQLLCYHGLREAGTTTTPASGLTAVTTSGIPGTLNIYPNPVRSNATILLNSADNGAKTINLYNASGVLTAKYAWQTSKGNNTFSLKDISGLPAGLYIADIRDNNGKPVGKVKFVKQ